jgi:hypothetical protein
MWQFADLRFADPPCGLKTSANLQNFNFSPVILQHHPGNRLWQVKGTQAW